MPRAQGAAELRPAAAELRRVGREDGAEERRRGAPGAGGGGAGRELGALEAHAAAVGGEEGAAVAEGRAVGKGAAAGCEGGAADGEGGPPLGGGPADEGDGVQGEGRPCVTTGKGFLVGRRHVRAELSCVCSGTGAGWEAAPPGKEEQGRRAPSETRKWRERPRASRTQSDGGTPGRRAGAAAGGAAAAQWAGEEAMVRDRPGPERASGRPSRATWARRETEETEGSARAERRSVREAATAVRVEAAEGSGFGAGGGARCAGSRGGGNEWGGKVRKGGSRPASWGQQREGERVERDGGAGCVLLTSAPPGAVPLRGLVVKLALTPLLGYAFTSARGG